MKRNSNCAGEEIPESHHTMPLRVGEEILAVVAAEETGQRRPQLTEAQSTQTGRMSCASHGAHFFIFDMRKAQV